MNRSLLIVICDFLLLSMLALARFDKTPEPAQNVAVQKIAPITELAGQDIVGSLKETLKSEADAKASMAQLLDERAKELARQRERTEQLEQETSRLQGEEERLERLRLQLEAERDKLREETIAAQAREKLVQDQLARREAELKAAQDNVNALQNEKGLAERDKAVLAERLDSAVSERRRLEGEVSTLREEKQAAHAEAAKLAANVGELAQAQHQTTEAISKKIRQVTPLSLNEVFDNFRKNRASIRFTTREAVLIGETDATYERYSVLVRDAGNKVYALCETAGTPLRLATLNRLRAVEGTLTLTGGRTTPAKSANFLRTDPRIVAFPMDEADLATIKAQPFALEDTPLRFPTAVVITAGGERYGEAPIRVVPGTSRYIEVQTSIANMLFGSFVPAEGDLVFSENGNLIGFMVSSGHAICLSDLAQTTSLDLGDAFTTAKAKTASGVLEKMATDDTQPHGRL
jgi:predicted  nucleic acid-binding Zn-ribbon protein